MQLQELMRCFLEILTSRHVSRARRRSVMVITITDQVRLPKYLQLPSTEYLYMLLLVMWLVVIECHFNGYHDVVVVITPSLPRDGGTARTAIQLHGVNLIEIRLGER